MAGVELGAGARVLIIAGGVGVVGFGVMTASRSSRTASGTSDSSAIAEEMSGEV